MKSNLDLLSLYGRRSVFRKRLEEGYSEVAFGEGELVDEERIVLWVFCHPDGKISTYEFRRVETPYGQVFHEMPFAQDFEPAEFREYVRERRIHLGKQVDLAGFIEKRQRDEIVPEIILWEKIAVESTH